MRLRLLVLLLCSFCAFAGSIPVTNSSFEAPFLGSGGWGYFENLAPAVGWDYSAPAFATVFYPTAASFTLAGDGSPDGHQVATLGHYVAGEIGTSGSIGQNLGAVAGGETYTVSVMVGNRLDVADTPGLMWGIRLLADGVVFGDISGQLSDITDGTFETQTLVATAPLSDAGKSLRLELYNVGFQVVFDNVQADVTPEPATFGLAAGAGLLVLILRRRSRKGA